MTQEKCPTCGRFVVDGEMAEGYFGPPPGYTNCDEVLPVIYCNERCYEQRPSTDNLWIGIKFGDLATIAITEDGEDWAKFHGPNRYKHGARAVACVNALDGISDPVLLREGFDLLTNGLRIHKTETGVFSFDLQGDEVARLLEIHKILKES